jgi:hypothetical protein
MEKTLSLALPASPEDINNALDGMFTEDQAVQAKIWCNAIVSAELDVGMPSLMLLRQCFKYLPAESIVCYMGSAINLKSEKDFRSFWCGEPHDWTGTVKMMDAGFDEKGWTAAFFPSVRPGYTAHEAAQMLTLMQQDGPPREKERRAHREDVFLSAFKDEKNSTQRPDMMFWREPSSWLARHKLSMSEQMQVWSAYALLADPQILTEIATQLRWSGWDVARHFVDWEAVTNPLASIRMLAASDIAKLHKDKTAPQELPSNLVFTN